MDFVAAENAHMPVAPDAAARVKRKMLEAYPSYASLENLDNLVAAEWPRQAGGISR